MTCFAAGCVRRSAQFGPLRTAIFCYGGWRCRRRQLCRCVGSQSGPKFAGLTLEDQRLWWEWRRRRKASPCFEYGRDRRAHVGRRRRSPVAGRCADGCAGGPMPGEGYRVRAVRSKGRRHSFFVLHGPAPVGGDPSGRTARPICAGRPLRQHRTPRGRGRFFRLLCAKFDYGNRPPRAIHPETANLRTAGQTRVPAPTVRASVQGWRGGAGRDRLPRGRGRQDQSVDNMNNDPGCGA